MRKKSKSVIMLSAIVLFAVLGYCFRDKTNSMYSEKIDNTELLNLDSAEKAVDSNTKQFVLNGNVANGKSLSKNEALTEIFRNEINKESIPRYFIPVKAIDGKIDNLKIVEESNAFLCNENNKTDNFIIKDYNSIKRGGKGDIDRGTISNTGNVEFLR